MAAKLTQEDFLNRCKEIHKDKYNYDKVIYVRSHDKVEIICPKEGHGSFFQSPSNHLSGKGCPLCRNESNSKRKTKTIERFIKLSQEVHGVDTYDYSVSVYKGMGEKIDIYCNKHKLIFSQLAKHHVNGHGCPKCSFERVAKTKRTSVKEFKEKAKEIHGVGRYDYSEAIYLNNHTPLTIICNKHGKPFRFKQRPNGHLSGQGCPRCAGNIKDSTPDFVRKVSKFHKGKGYDYSKVEYRGCHKKVIVICPTHGEFEILANDLLNKSGCPMCAEYGFSKVKPATLYYLRIYHDDQNFYKIGVTNRDVSTRFNKSDFKKIDVICSWSFDKGAEAYTIEQSILETHKHNLSNRKDILSDGYTEIFNHDVLMMDS